MFSKFMRLIYPDVELSFFFYYKLHCHTEREIRILKQRKKATRLSEMSGRQNNITEKETRELKEPKVETNLHIKLFFYFREQGQDIMSWFFLFDSAFNLMVCFCMIFLKYVRYIRFTRANQKYEFKTIGLSIIHFS